PALYLTIASGVVLMTMEISTIGLQWLFMGKGATVLLKPSGSYCPDRGGSGVTSPRENAGHATSSSLVE
ncbi:MAG TPA: hypothetical protein VN444_08065, partial [Verrucomicrobiae bacterium]|nr:hypothetical protein [Verrucomicrobiae bacterium]